ncbi:Pantothenate synthetase [Rhynchospora pubera]|uniref:Pantoate--beta-alanine ligase n=1 Tax=Rhynchospora pubera TaxID=906938 RepID=A0AAV8GZ42_9POAL|nr:Pantothenate synthetase [Rhynchospora pubera]KAJ4809650.1 Pantothenate synthetase [Rhynchospora pubera]
MEVIREKADMRAWSRRMRRDGKSLALVPTMGYLHEGHLSLVREARAHADVIVVSVYVNPGQFAPSEDLSTYPSDLQGDLLKLSQSGVVQAVFCPTNLYDYDTPGPLSVPPRQRPSAGSGEEQAPVSCLEKEKGGGTHETWVRVERLEKGMCGASRPVFFRGVATVVTKLFHIVEPDVAVFGKKDYQQWRIISRMVRDLDFAIEIIGSEIVREADGLAMSSRNVRLSPRDRKQALSINKALSEAKVHVSKGSVSSQELKDRIIQTVADAGGRIDYVEIVEQESLEHVEKIKCSVVICIAAWFGDVRLIDNIEIDVPAEK